MRIRTPHIATLIFAMVLGALAPFAAAQTTPASPAVTAAPVPTPTAPVAAADSSAATAPVSVPAAPRMSLPASAFDAAGTPVSGEVLAARSLLFNAKELDLIVTTLVRASRRPGAAVAPIVGADGTTLVPGTSAFGAPEVAAPQLPPIPTKRTITLSGVLFKGPGDWVVWLNGHKLVPGRTLPEIVGMDVERDRVHLRWFDIGLGKVIRLTLRPHQTYDVTSGLLLTGERAP